LVAVQIDGDLLAAGIGTQIEKIAPILGIGLLAVPRGTDDGGAAGLGTVGPGHHPLNRACDGGAGGKQGKNGGGGENFHQHEHNPPDRDEQHDGPHHAARQKARQKLLTPV